MAMPIRRPIFGALLLLTGGAAAALVWTGLEPPAVHGPAAAGPAALPDEQVFSFLAVGDTGDLLPWRPFGEGQRSVARGLVAEDRRLPVEALVLLGDNFYPDGLQRFQLVERIRHNLVIPFCHFAAAGAPRWPEVKDGCPIAKSERHTVPILAVLGNHDYNTEESPRLQREEMPRFVSNWNVHPGIADVGELGRGISLVRADSEAIQQAGTAEPVREALEHSRGRWRILAVHRPIALREGETPKPDSFKGLMRRALAGTRRPPQLVLSGHDHNLQVVPTNFGAPALQVIAGSGSSRRRFKQPPYADRAFGVETTGFARIDLLGHGKDQGLLVSLYTMPRYPIHAWREPRLVSRWWVETNGAAGRVYPPKS